MTNRQPVMRMSGFSFMTVRLRFRSVYSPPRPPEGENRKVARATFPGGPTPPSLREPAEETIRFPLRPCRVICHRFGQRHHQPVVLAGGYQVYRLVQIVRRRVITVGQPRRSEEHTSELQSPK